MVRLKRPAVEASRLTSCSKEKTPDNTNLFNSDSEDAPSPEPTSKFASPSSTVLRSDQKIPETAPSTKITNLSSSPTADRITAALQGQIGKKSAPARGMTQLTFCLKHTNNILSFRLHS
jgi:hypothetical protein